MFKPLKSVLLLAVIYGCSTSIVTENRETDTSTPDGASPPALVTGSYLHPSNARIRCPFELVSSSKEKFLVNCSVLAVDNAGKETNKFDIPPDVKLTWHVPKIESGKVESISCSQPVVNATSFQCTVQSSYAKIEFGITVANATESQQETQDVTVPWAVGRGIGLVPSQGQLRLSTNESSSVETPILSIDRPLFPAHYVANYRGPFCAGPKGTFVGSGGKIFQVFENDLAIHYAGGDRQDSLSEKNRLRYRFGSISKLTCRDDGIEVYSSSSIHFIPYNKPEVEKIDVKNHGSRDANGATIPALGGFYKAAVVDSSALVLTIRGYVNSAAVYLIERVNLENGERVIVAGKPGPLPQNYSSTELSGKAIENFLTTEKVQFIPETNRSFFMRILSPQHQFDHTTQIMYFVSEEGDIQKHITLGSHSLELKDIQTIARSDNGYYYVKNHELYSFSSQSGSEKIVSQSELCSLMKCTLSGYPSSIQEIHVFGNKVYLSATIGDFANKMFLFEIENKKVVKDLFLIKDSAIDDASKIMVRIGYIKGVNADEFLVTDALSQKVLKVDRNQKVSTVMNTGGSYMVDMDAHGNLYVTRENDHGGDDLYRVSPSNEELLISDLPYEAKIKVGDDGKIYLIYEGSSASCENSSTIVRRYSAQGVSEALLNYASQSCTIGAHHITKDGVIYFSDEILGDIYKAVPTGANYQLELVYQAHDICIPDDINVFCDVKVDGKFVNGFKYYNIKMRSDNKLILLDQNNDITMLDLNKPLPLPGKKQFERKVVFEGTTSQKDCGTGMFTGTGVRSFQASLAAICSGAIVGMDVIDNCLEPNGTYSIFFAQRFSDGTNGITVKSTCVD